MYVMVEGRKLLMGLALLAVLLIPGVLYLGYLDDLGETSLVSAGEPETVGETVKTGSWGLCFRNPGQPPVADVSEAAISQFDAKYIGNQQEKKVYLTFDCGYESGCTEHILDVLKAHEIPAAFFVVGNYLETEPELIRRMVEEGHIVGNHTWNHPNMSEISDKAAFETQLRKVSDAYREITGEDMPMYYRPPQGIYSQENLKMAQELGYKTVFWSLAYVDWKQDQQPDRKDAMEKLTSRIHNGAVILLHNTSETNNEILDEQLTCWENMGYTFGTLDELFAD